MKDMTNGKLAEIKTFAGTLPVEVAQTFQRCLDNIQLVDENYKKNGHPAETVLFSDFAPYSLYFVRKNTKTGQMYGNGGIIFHGTHDNGGDGSGPTFSVNLTPFSGWSIHT